jgi:hypothetical protein
MPFEESWERIKMRRWQERNRRRGVSREEGSGVREGVTADIRSNGLFDDQSGVALTGLLLSSGSWGGEG